ncbi:MAG: helix-turn-helix domain-containing protein [Thiothrix sp.]|uniref:helix-turn-helix transcriptional regulator n=1 Tax=Thiothrix sp. TaxID=1032 RepID=UPI00261FACC9|nr:helix-turn-helix domain-containing protein [Thiothrix sp.]MDD5395583.1 helix-turn-helix domain-containing protein [Thiothrix sp.]
MLPKLLTNKETAALLGVKPATLDLWRWQGKGPVFRKIGSNVRYAESDLLAYLEAGTRQSTSQQFHPQT